MKQNEKILVYAVTGFLVVILGVAILFGKEVPRRLPGDLREADEVASAPPSLEDVLNRRARGTSGPVDPIDGAEPDGAEPAAGDPASGSDGLPVADSPLVANVQLLPPTAAAMVTERLGLSRQDRGFRLVRARPGDTLSALVQKWCGSLDYLEQAQGLNETLTTLSVGQDVVLPWIEDETLLAAFETRLAAAGIDDSTVPTVPAVALGGGRRPVPEPALATDAANAGRADAGTSVAVRKYKVKPGDSLWRIAEREVGRRQVPGFLEQVRELNPGLDADRIREGQEILLPRKD